MANMQAMQESLLKAADIIVTQRINELELDKTITAIVKKNLGQKNGTPVYQVYYSGGTFNAICQSADDVYLPNTSVYVLIPQGNFSNEKIIIGLTNKSEIKEQTVAMIEENVYAKLTSNLLTGDKDEVYGLHSWHENNALDDNVDHYYQYIYQNNDINNQNKFNFDLDALDIYKDETIALMIKADFRTNLDVEQKRQSKAKYGLIFNFIVNNQCEQYILNSQNMSGNPFSFSQWNEQYHIIKIDKNSLNNLDSIIFFQEGFLQNYNTEQIWPPSEPGGPDIFMKNPQIYLLKNVNQLNDYSLKVEPYNNDNELIQFKATFLRKEYEDLTSNINTKIYWFKESFDVTIFVNVNYNTLAGICWKEFTDLNISEIFTISINENKAFKNNYKCIIEYNGIILDDIFAIYNRISAPQIKLESNLGTKFSFNSGEPTVSIKIKEDTETAFKEKGYDEQDLFPDYIYNWCIIDNNNTKIFLNEENNSVLSNLNKENIRQQILLSNGMLIDSFNSQYTTRISFSITDMNNNFNIICYVKKRDQDTNEYYEIGSADLNFINSNSDTINNYQIKILNDDQVFKYDIYGKAPIDISNKNPLTIEPLQAKLLTLNEIEIDSNNYKVEWIFPPKEESLLTLISAENDKCIFTIKEEYDPNCYNNQITCRITFNDNILYKDTRFYFGKEGSNGTNGTDIVAKIEYARNNDYNNLLQKEPVTLYTYNNESFLNTEPIYNKKSSQIIFRNNKFIDTIPVFEVSLYQRSKKINYTNSPSYYLAGNYDGKYFDTGLNLVWNGTKNNKELPLIQNIKAEIQLNKDETYYAFVSLPIIEYYVNPATQESLISIDKQYYLNEIVYNNDGRNPIYNHNQGLKLNLPDNITIIEYTAKGGLEKQLITTLEGNEVKEYNTYFENAPCFALLEAKDSETKYHTLTKVGPEKNIIYIIPDDNYGGSITNNRIEAKCYDKDNNLIAIIYAPIHMSLNTFGLASLNAWDGNSVTIDNEGGYVMAPQIGAGEKDNNNRFTGILMGKTETYTGKAEKEKQIGLFGYSSGLQSIFLDAETGNATFGLPEGYTLKTDNGITLPVKDLDDYGEGRIELRPGGESKIGGWKIGRRSLYYTMEPIPIFDIAGTTINNYWAESDGRYSYKYSGEIGSKYTNDEETPKGRDYAAHHKKDIKVHDSGILFSSDPPYMSIVGTMLTEAEIVGDSDAYLKRGDSVEIQLDPQTPTVFTIFRHNSEFRKQEAAQNGKVLGDRTFLAGINARGQLQANIIGTTDDNNNQASMYFGLTKRFNQSEQDNTEYIGAIFEAGREIEQNSIIKPYLKLLVDRTEFENNNLENIDIDNVYLSVQGALNIDFAPTTYNSGNVSENMVSINNGHYQMTVNTLKDAIEGCLKAAEKVSSGGLYIYNGND